MEHADWGQHVLALFLRFVQLAVTYVTLLRALSPIVVQQSLGQL